jgi:hypothetical protein
MSREEVMAQLAPMFGAAEPVDIPLEKSLLHLLRLHGWHDSADELAQLINEVRDLRKDCDEGRNIIRALQGEIELLKRPWLPISQAPKDGTVVLLFGRGPAWDHYETSVMVGQWHNNQWLITHSEAPEHVFPTHFMYLPEPPKE